MNADLPSHDLEAEQAVLGCVLIEPETVEVLRPVIDPSDFYDVRHRAIYSAMLHLGGGRQPDHVNLASFLREEGKLALAGGENYLAHLLRCVPAYTRAVQYAGTVREHAKRRRLLEVATALVRDAHSGDSAKAIRTARAELAALDEESPPQELDAAPDCPALPERAQPDPELGQGAGFWVRLYTGYAGDVSPMTPDRFHESAALWLGAVTIARRLRLCMPFGEVYPNLFVLWLAPTTLYRKSTALEVARRVARKVVPHLLAAQEMTPEAFLSDLAGREPPMLDALSEQDRAAWTARRAYAAQRGMILDEMSGLMAGAGKDYNAGLVESLLRFYDCDPRYERSTRAQGQVIVRNSSLCLLGASTPAAMFPHIRSERLWAMGWWPRFAILTPEEQRPEWQEPRDVEEPAELCEWLQELDKRLPAATWPNAAEAHDAALGEGVYEAWQAYNRAVSYDLLTPELDLRLHGTYGRLPSQALKVALTLAALDGWEGCAPTVEMRHLARAIEVCEGWRASAHRALHAADENGFGRLRERVLRKVSLHGPEGVTMRNIYRAMQDKKPAEVVDVALQLVEVGELEEVETRAQGRGMKTKYYRLGRT